MSGTKSLFIPSNPNKYIGKSPIVMRSNWERNFAHWCDNQDVVVKWSSESVRIPYYNPVKRKNTVYIPDFLIWRKGNSGEVKRFLIEIKPHSETKKPRKSKKKSKKTLLIEEINYQTNTAKWYAAKEWCALNDVEFLIITEKKWKFI